MSSVGHETLEKMGDAATAVISIAAGTVADPKTALEMARARSRKMAPLAALFVLAVLLVAVRRRRSGD